MALTNFEINFNSTIETVSFGTFTKMFELGEISFLIDFFKESEINSIKSVILTSVVIFSDTKQGTPALCVSIKITGSPS